MQPSDLLAFSMLGLLHLLAAKGGALAARPGKQLCSLASSLLCLQHCIAAKGWKIIIADESHTLRTGGRAPDAAHTEATVSALKRSRRAILLTGTPSLSRPFDLFRQVSQQVQGSSKDVALKPAQAGEQRPTVSLDARLARHVADRSHQGVITCSDR